MSIDDTSDAVRMTCVLPAKVTVNVYKNGENVKREPRGAFGGAKTERALQAEHKKLKWTVGALEWKRMGDAGKARIAQRLRAETTMTREWIAGQLRMGTKTHLCH